MYKETNREIANQIFNKAQDFEDKEDANHDALIIFHCENTDSEHADTKMFYAGCPCLLGQAMESLAKEDDAFKAVIIRTAFKMIGIRVEIIKNDRALQDLISMMKSRQDPNKN